MNLQLQLLDKNLHDRGSFDCGVSAVNDFLRNNARQQMENRVNRTWILTDAAHPAESLKPILGFFTLTSATVMRSELPDADTRKSFPMYPLPVIKLAWLGVSLQLQRSSMRLGETLLMEALHMAKRIVERSGLGIAVVIDPLTEESECFFRHYGFSSMGRVFRGRHTLFLSMKTVELLSNEEIDRAMTTR